MFLPTEDGVLYTFGSDYWGCVGCNNELDEKVTTPYRVDFFAQNPVEQVTCGECHIVALTGGLLVPVMSVPGICCVDRYCEVNRCVVILCVRW